LASGIESRKGRRTGTITRSRKKASILYKKRTGAESSSWRREEKGFLRKVFYPREVLRGEKGKNSLPLGRKTNNIPGGSITYSLMTGKGEQPQYLTRQGGQVLVLGVL